MFDAEAPADHTLTRPLGQARPGDGGRVHSVGGSAELERRLLEIGFVEGAHIRVLHQGPFGGDPIAVQVDDTRVALRRREAFAVRFLPEAPPSASGVR